MLNQTDLSRADLNLLVLFEAVLREGHVGRAADALSLSPSAVSHGLGRLRRQLNDPLFLRTPKGVVPTERAQALAGPIADVLARVRNVLATAEPFDPRTSTRRFVVGAPDGVSAVLLPPLLAQLREQAPGIDISIRQVMPMPGETAPERAWRSTLAELENRSLDVAVIPAVTFPLRFHVQHLVEEDFVIAMRTGHRLASKLGLEAYCSAEHLVVSHNGEPYGFVDEALAQRGLQRRVALTVPNFMFALAVLPETDLLCALPRRLVDLHGARFRIVATEAPLTFPLGSSPLNAVAPKVAMMDAGLAWLLEQLRAASTDLRAS